MGTCLPGITPLAFLVLAGSLTAAPGSRCGGCHAAQARPQSESAMAHAMEGVATCQTLLEHPRLNLQLGNYTYQIARQGDQSTYTVSDGRATMRVPLAWAFGMGAAGQTYLYESDGAWYESRISFFKETERLDMTMGGAISPRTLEEAAGRRMGPTEAAQCFDCHTTGAVRAGKLDMTGLTAGVQCERCHGSAEAHPQALNKMPMRKLGELGTEHMFDFCGQCHGTWSRIMTNGPRGVFNVRFQPYRLTNSKCFDADDRRISCTACHDPHQNAVTRPAAYDSKCLACHSRGSSFRDARICRVGKTDCVGCHMVKIELPGAHHKFTDHWIRIVRAGETYPD